jgi:drug/metabolite transporter (DMT)-like permease
MELGVDGGRVVGSARDESGVARGSSRCGILLGALSAAAYSTSGLFTRLIALDAWTILFWRGVFGGLLIAAWVLWQERGATPRAFRAIGWIGLAYAACSALATQSALLQTLQVPLAPAWVWLGFGELPSAASCIGGAIVLGAVAGDAMLERAVPQVAEKSA